CSAVLTEAHTAAPANSGSSPATMGVALRFPYNAAVRGPAITAIPRPAGRQKAAVIRRTDSILFSSRCFLPELHAAVTLGRALMPKACATAGMTINRVWAFP